LIRRLEGHDRSNWPVPFRHDQDVVVKIGGVLGKCPGCLRELDGLHS
jgi:hypothetical protein